MHRVLIVEDEAGWRAEIKDVLADYDVVEAATLIQAVRAIDAHQNGVTPLDVIVLDLSLSAVSDTAGGQSVLTHLKTAGCTLPCIVLTGRALTISAAERLYREYGIVAGLEKPDGLAQLAITVQHALNTAPRRSPPGDQAAAPIGQPGITGETVNIGEDVVGRDKLVSQQISIRVEAGATLIVKADQPPTVEPPATDPAATS